MTSYQLRNDPYFLKTGVETSGEHDIAVIKRQEVDIQNLSLIPYTLTKSNDEKNKECGVHFFLDDIRFKEVFDYPEKAFKRICGYKFLLTPDLSLYQEMPSWKIISNLCNARYIGAVWQSKGKTVIPTMSWAGPPSFSLCFSGIEKGCVVAVSTVGCRHSEFDFMLGYDQMLRAVEPSAIICFGKPFKEMQGNIIYVPYSKNSKISTAEAISANKDLHIEDNYLLPFPELVS